MTRKNRAIAVGAATMLCVASVAALASGVDPAATALGWDGAHLMLAVGGTGTAAGCAFLLGRLSHQSEGGR